MRFAIDGYAVQRHSWERRLSRQITADGEPCYGLCEHENRVIRIERGLPPRREFRVDVHEALHAVFPFLSEHAIDMADEALTKLLFDKLGYRKISI